MIKNNYKHTVYACYIGYITQAILINFVPLLFLTFNKNYGIPLGKVTLLITFNFTVQLVVDFFAIYLIKYIGQRKAIVSSHFLSSLGLVLLAFLPNIMNDKFLALLLSVVVYSVGSGLLEVLVSPIVEACPSDNKAGTMSILHSFYCWGQMGVVIISTLFFSLVGIQNWQILALIWAIVPFLNAFYFALVPLNILQGDNEKVSLKKMVSSKIFWIFVVMMIASGASELSMSQWASSLAESGLGVSKTIGDLAGPCMFAMFMGIARMIYGKFSDKLDLQKAMIFSAVLCFGCYVVCVSTNVPIISLLACGFCGFSVGIMWPGTFSLAMLKCPNASTLMFALLALGGDVGATVGPTIVGFASSYLGDDLKSGIGLGMIFPILLILSVIMVIKETRKIRNI